MKHSGKGLFSSFPPLRLALLLPLCVPPAQAAGAWETWHWRHPSPTGNNLQSIAFGRGMFVAVGERGALQTSSNASDWEDLPRLTTNHLNRVTFVNDRFIVLGQGGIILGSTDGLSWSVTTLGAAEGLETIAYGNSMYVMGSAEGSLWTSTNLTDWVLGPPGDQHPRIAFGNGLFVMGSGGTFARWQTSPDGVQWTPTLEPSRLTQAIEFGNGRFVVRTQTAGSAGVLLNGSAVSVDGTNWVYESRSGTAVFVETRALRFLNGRFVDLGPSNTRGTVSISEQGTNWTTVPLPEPGVGFQDVAYGAERYVVVGSLGQLLTATNGIDWTEASAGPRGRITSLAQGGGRYVAVGGGVPSQNFLRGSAEPILVSADGIRFQPSAYPYAHMLTAVAYGGGAFVAVGAGGAALYSTTGNDWVTAKSGTYQDLTAVWYLDGHWYACGYGGVVLHSTDGLVWALASAVTDYHLLGGTYGHGLHVVVGDVGAVLTSADGKDWEPRYTDTTQALSSVAFGNGRFVAVGNGGGVLTSEDGTTWTARDSGVTEPFGTVTYGGGRFLATTWSSGFPVSSTPFLLTSTDGAAWERVMPQTPAVWGTAFLDQSFWILGEGGAILQSDPINPPITLTAHPDSGSGRIVLDIQSPAAPAYRIQACTNLQDTHWDDLVTLSNSQSWVDPAPVPTRFYRVVSP